MAVLIPSLIERTNPLPEFKTAEEVPSDTIVDIAATPEFAKLLDRSGFNIPVYITFEAFAKCVTTPGVELPKGQSVKKRLWDLLAACQRAIEHGTNATGFTFRAIDAKQRREPIRIKCELGKDDFQECYVISLAAPAKR